LRGEHGTATNAQPEKKLGAEISDELLIKERADFIRRSSALMRIACCFLFTLSEKNAGITSLLLIAEKL
jgi:hypothetical protein